jgi:predicted transcriptional regulator
MLNNGHDLAENLLVSLDMRRNSVKVLIYMAKHNEVTSDDLEVSLGIGQPSVSAAIKDIDQKGWLTIEQIHTDSKGRPRHKYRLSKDFSSIAVEIEDMARNLIVNINGGLCYLRSF